MMLDRLVVVGNSGSGKSTFARRAAQALGHPCIELDAIHWLPGWRERPHHEFEALLSARLSEPAWVVDGNYSASRSLIWGRATALVWLDYPFAFSFARLFRRTVERIHTGEEICNGNRESFRESFVSRKSVLWWALTAHPAYRRTYAREITAYPHLEAHVFRRAIQAEEFLSRIENTDRCSVGATPFPGRPSRPC